MLYCQCITCEQDKKPYKEVLLTYHVTVMLAYRMLLDKETFQKKNVYKLKHSKSMRHTVLKIKG